MFSGVKAPLVAVVLAICSYFLIKAYSAITGHLEYVKTLEKDNSSLSEENSSLTELTNSLKLSTLQQQEHIGVLELEMKARETALKEHAEKQSEMEKRLAKLSEESRNAIISITSEIKRAGLQNLRVPDSVIRMQRERAKKINTGSHSNNQSGSDAPKAGDAVPPVPDTRG